MDNINSHIFSFCSTRQPENYDRDGDAHKKIDWKARRKIIFCRDDRNSSQCRWGMVPDR